MTSFLTRKKCYFKTLKSENCKADVSKTVLCFPVRPPIKSYFDKNFIVIRF